MSVFYKPPLPLPLGEVDEQSEDGEGKLGCNALSVTYGDSSPKGRAKGLCPIKKFVGIIFPTLANNTTGNHFLEVLPCSEIDYYKVNTFPYPALRNAITPI